MPHSIVWTEYSREDLLVHFSFIKNVSLKAAQNFVANVEKAVESLSNYPERFPVFEMMKNFKIVIRKLIVDGRYIVLFAVEDDTIVIYRVLDSRKNFNSLL